MAFGRYGRTHHGGSGVVGWLLAGTLHACFAPVSCLGGDSLEAILGPVLPPKAVIIGDSIARGASDTGEQLEATETFTFYMFSEGLFVTTMAHHMGAAVNLPRYNDALEEQNAFDPWKFTMIMLGTNDFSFGIPIAEVVDRYGAFLDIAVSSLWYEHPKVPQVIFCVTPLTRADGGNRNESGYTLDELRTAIRNLCESRSLPVLDGPALLPADPEIQRDRESRYFSDGLHLNGAGHRLLAQSLLASALIYFANHPDHPPLISLTEYGRDLVGSYDERICKVPRQELESLGLR